MKRIITAWSWFWEKVASYAVKFGVVGLVGMVIDIGLFNLLRLGVFGDGHFFQGPIGAKIASVSVAIAFNWLGSRYWAFREHRRRNFVKELAEYVLVSVGGMLIGLLCLYVSHYVLGFDNLLADNIASNVIGLGLGTIFRFALFRFWVYGHHRSDGIHAASRVEEAELALFEEPQHEEAGADGRGRVAAGVPFETPLRGSSGHEATPLRGSSGHEVTQPHGSTPVRASGRGTESPS